MRFRAETPLCDLEQDIGKEALQILAEGMSRGEYLGSRPVSGPIPNAVLTYVLDEKDLVRSLTIYFTSDDELRCVHEHSLIRPALQHRGYYSTLTRAGKPRRAGQPVPWRRSEWRNESGETVVVELARQPHFSSLKLTRAFDPNRPFRPSTRGLEAFFF
jgi:hypothetical protein